MKLILILPSNSEWDNKQVYFKKCQSVPLKSNADYTSGRQMQWPDLMWVWVDVSHLTLWAWGFRIVELFQDYCKSTILSLYYIKMFHLLYRCKHQPLEIFAPPLSDQILEPVYMTACCLLQYIFMHYGAHCITLKVFTHPDVVFSCQLFAQNIFFDLLIGH